MYGGNRDLPSRVPARCAVAPVLPPAAVFQWLLLRHEVSRDDRCAQPVGASRRHRAAARAGAEDDDVVGVRVTDCGAAAPTYRGPADDPVPASSGAGRRWRARGSSLAPSARGWHARSPVIASIGEIAHPGSGGAAPPRARDESPFDSRDHTVASVQLDRRCPGKATELAGIEQRPTAPLSFETPPYSCARRDLP